MNPARHQSNFELVPFTPIPFDLRITGAITVEEQKYLQINYLLTGDLDCIDIPSPSTQPTRKDDLWENTCLEFFLGVENSPRYWEFNLAPCGDWNIYRFDDYRQGMQTETSVTQLPITVDQSPTRFELSLTVDLSFAAIAVGTAIDVAITTVIKSQDADITYWALTHPGQAADFHLRDGFILHFKDPANF